MFNPGQANSRPSGLYHSPSAKDLRSKRGIFTNAGLSTLSGQDDSIQHNYRYQVDREKIRRDAEAAELNKLKRFQSEANYQTLSNVHPNAYKSYANNLDKIGVGLDQADAYVNEVQSAKERLFQDQQNMLSLQKLNRLNAEQHKQHLQRQMNRIRDPVRENDFPPFRPAVNTRSVDNIGSRNYINDTEQDIKLSLLDKFSLNNGLEDQLSSFAPNSGGLTGRSNTGLDNSRDYGDMSRYMGATAGTRAPTSSFRPREVREPVQQYSPYLPSPGYNQPPPQQYYPVPGYGGYNAPPPSSENLEMKVYMQKQTDLLERISDKLAKRKAESREKPRRDTRDFEHRFRDFEKETELRMQLMKQQQTIENLQTQTTQPRQKQTESRQSRYRNNDEPKSNNPPGHYHSQSQPDIFNPQNLVQSFMQHMNPFGGYNPANPTNNPLVNSLMFPQGYDPYMNPYAYGMYPDQMYSQFSPYAYSAGIKDKKKKRKKSKKRTKADSDDSDSDKPDSDDSDDDSTGKSRRRSKSSKKKKDKDTKDKKSKDRKGSKKGGDGDEDEISPEEKKKKARSNLRSILWTIAYQKIFETDISQKVTNRRAAHQQDIYNRLDPIAQNFATWLMNVAQEGFTKLFDDVKKTYDFVGLDFKKPSRSDVVKRATEAKKQTKFLIETLIAKTDANPIDNNNLEFLTGVCYKNVYLSDNTFSVFELMRIKSNAWGRIIDMTPQHSQMILSCILIIRLLAFQLVLKANEWNNKIKWTPQALANFKIVGSLLYRITVSMWEEILPVVTEKPSQLGCVPLPPLTLDPILAPVDDTPDNPEMIFGTISKAQLAPVLEEDKPWTDSMKQLIFSWTASIYNKIDAYRMQNPAKEPQLAGGEGMMAGMVNQATGH